MLRIRYGRFQVSSLIIHPSSFAGSLRSSSAPLASGLIDGTFLPSPPAAARNYYDSLRALASLKNRIAAAMKKAAMQY
jgi:hypothetical protein